MLSDPRLFLALAILGVGLFHLIPRHRAEDRHRFALFWSLVVLLILAPVALLLVLSMCLLTWVFLRLQRRVRHRLVLFGGIAALVAVNIAVEVRGQREADDAGSTDAGTLFVTLGLAFVLLKSIDLLVEAYLTGETRSFREITLLNTFFPLFAAGPIETSRALAPSRFSQPVPWAVVLSALLRLALGWFKLYYLSLQVIGSYIDTRYPKFLTDPGVYSSGDLAFLTYASFLGIYINFSGYCDIAIGISRFFGLEIIENFDKPWLATNVKEFWQRWHRSLGRFILRNIYSPVVRQGWRLEPWIVVSFVLIGLWHHLSLQFLLWGVANGLGFAYTFYLGRARLPQALARLRSSGVYRFVCIIITLSYLSVISTFVRMQDFDVGLNYLRALIQ